MSGEEGKDDMVVFDNFTELVADTSILELTAAVDPRPTSPARAVPCPPDGNTLGPGAGAGGGGGGRCKAGYVALKLLHGTQTELFYAVSNLKTIVCCFVPLLLMLGRYWSAVPPAGLPDMYTLKISLNRFSVDLPNV